MQREELDLIDRALHKLGSRDDAVRLLARQALLDAGGPGRKRLLDCVRSEQRRIARKRIAGLFAMATVVFVGCAIDVSLFNANHFDTLLLVWGGLLLFILLSGRPDNWYPEALALLCEGRNYCDIPALAEVLPYTDGSQQLRLRSRLAELLFTVPPCDLGWLTPNTEKLILQPLEMTDDAFRELSESECNHLQSVCCFAVTARCTAAIRALSRISRLSAPYRRHADVRKTALEALQRLREIDIQESSTRLLLHPVLSPVEELLRPTLNYLGDPSVSLVRTVEQNGL